MQVVGPSHPQHRLSGYQNIYSEIHICNLYLFSIHLQLTRCQESGRQKCAKYWPSQGSETCKDYIITVVEILEFPDHLIRTFHLSKSGHAVERVVKQFHFIGWPDHGVPSDASALFSLLKKVNRWRETCVDVNGPLVSCLFKSSSHQ